MATRLRSSDEIAVVRVPHTATWPIKNRASSRITVNERVILVFRVQLLKRSKHRRVGIRRRFFAPPQRSRVTRRSRYGDYWPISEFVFARTPPGDFRLLPKSKTLEGSFVPVEIDYSGYAERFTGRSVLSAGVNLKKSDERRQTYTHGRR